MLEAAENIEPTEFESTNEGKVEEKETTEAVETNKEESDETKEEVSTSEGEEKEEVTAEKEEVGFSDFLKARGVEVDKTLIETKKEDKKEKKSFTPRVLDDIPEEDRPLFKSMSNESFTKLKPIYLEYKTLKQENETLKNKKPDGASVYGHPDAFTLTKEYRTYSRDYNLADQIKSHWALQSAKISRGEKWQDLDMDPKTGKLILSEPKESNAEAETFVGDQLQMSREQLSEAKNQLKGFIDGYSTTYKNDLQVVNAATEKYFPGYSAKDHVTQPIQKAVIDALPASFRDNPVATLLAMTAANNAILMGRLKKALDEISKLKGIKSDVEGAQPKKGEFINGKGATGEIKFSDFASRRAQY